MSSTNILNVNEEIALVTLAANVAQTIALPFMPEFIEVTNSGTGTCYYRLTNSAGTMTVPTSTFAGGSECQPGASKSYRGATGWGVPAATTENRYIALISPAGTTVSIKVGRGI